MNAVDTNVFVYAFDTHEPDKQAKAQQLLDRLVVAPLETLLFWQVAGEFLNCLRRWELASRISAADVEVNFRSAFVLFPLQLPAASLLDSTFDLHSRFSLSHWDSMLIAACKEAGVDTLYTEDLDPGTDYDGVKVVNPFA